MVVNTEAGSYDKMPRTDIDLAFDAATLRPNIGVAEKMTSGAYLGALCEFTLKAAAEESVFRTKAVEEIERLQSADVSEFLQYGSGVIAEYMIGGEDEANARALLENIVLRAARMAALQMAAIAEKAHKANKRICMSVEGTTYEKMFGLKEELRRGLLAYLSARGYEVELVTVGQAVLKGCAIAGLAR
jgi:hexokinase